MASKIDISKTFGACFVALLISMVLYGITLLQTYLYYLRFPKDSHTKKILVAVVCAIDTFQTILITHGIYYYLVLNYQNPPALQVGTWSFILEVVITDVIACIVQCFFASQVYSLSRGWILTGVITILAVIQVGFSLAFTIKGFETESFASLEEPIFKTLLLGHLVSSLAADIFITLALCYYFQSARTGHTRTEHVINKLLVYTINRGILTGLSALLELVFYLSMPRNFIFIGVHFITSKLYVVSFMATLNIRQPSRDKDISLSNLSVSGSGQHTTVPPNIRVTRTVEKRTDALGAGMGSPRSATFLDAGLRRERESMGYLDSPRSDRFPPSPVKEHHRDSDEDFLYPTNLKTKEQNQGRDVALAL